MQYISIHDYENNRVIISELPDYLQNKSRTHEDDDIAQAVFDALGISSSNVEYMLGDFDVQLDVRVINGNHGYNHNVNQGIEQLTQNFKEDALASLKESSE